ncbi:hypothetical protein IWW55_005333, partial [Coemansia sp. RSA 2706]
RCGKPANTTYAQPSGKLVVRRAHPPHQHHHHHQHQQPRRLHRPPRMKFGTQAPKATFHPRSTTSQLRFCHSYSGRESGRRSRRPLARSTSCGSSRRRILSI